MNRDAISPFYEKRSPSEQTIADIFKGHWKSALPGIASGSEPMFDDPRPQWAAMHIPGGFSGKSVLELGPFEAYQTYLLLREGAAGVVSVEANSINYLKCLCLKEILQLQASFRFGDILSFVRECQQSFDVVWASGMLYHLQDPVEFIETIPRLGRYIYVWTHYFDAEAMNHLDRSQARLFVPDLNKSRRQNGREILLHARSYFLQDYEAGLPMNWQGGLEQVSFWLEKDDIYWLFEQVGMRVRAIQGYAEVSGLPCMSFLLESAH